MEALDPAISFRPATGQRQALRDLATSRGCTVADVIRSAVAVELACRALGHVDDPLAASATAYPPDDDIDALADRLAAGGASL